MVNKQISARLVLSFTLAALIGGLLLESASAQNHPRPVNEARKLLRVSAEVTDALTQASNQNGELLRWTKHQGRCWGRTLGAYSQFTGSELDGGPARHVILPYVSLSQQQAFYRWNFGTADWGRGKLRASRPALKTVGTIRRAPVAGRAISGGLGLPSRPAPWEPIYRGYRGYLNNLRPVSAIKIQADPCALLQKWQDQSFTGAWKLVSAATGLSSWDQLDRLYRARVIAPENDTYRAADGLYRLLPVKRPAVERQIISFSYGPYRRLVGVYSRGLSQGLNEFSERQ